MNGLPWRVQIYLGLVLGAALLLGGQLLIQQGIPDTGELPLAGLLAVGMMLAWMFPLPVGFKTHFYLDTAVIIAAVLLFDSGAALVIVGAGTLAAQCIRRRFWDETLFNTGQAMLQAAVASVLISVAGYQPGAPEVDSPGFVVAVAAAGIALLVVSAVLVGMIVSLQGGFNPLGVWAESILKADDAVYLGHVAQIGLGIVIVVLGDSHPWTIVLIIPLVAVVYVALRHGFELRQQAEIALRFSEKSLTEAQRLARIGSWEWDLASGAQGWSGETFRILGLEPMSQAPNYQYLLDHVHPDDRQRVDREIHEAIRVRGQFDLEHRIVSVAGEEFVVHHRGEVIQDDADTRARLIATIHDISERKSLESRLEYMAYHDPLTGLPNRNFLADRLDAAAEEWRSGGHRFALMFVDLDFFKAVNDSLGHEHGDRLLTEIGERLVGGLRQDDVVARYGGDEFVILARSVDDQAMAERLAARLVDALATIIPSDSAEVAEVPVTASVGLVIPESRLDSPHDLFHRADVALYHAKREGRNRYAVYDPTMEHDGSQAFRIPGAGEDDAVVAEVMATRQQRRF